MYMPLTEMEKRWTNDLAGLFCGPGEWCAAGAIGGSVTIIGHLRPPEDGEPMVARFMVSESRGSGIYAIQQLAPGTYRCLISGDIIEWADDRVKVYSALSRILGGLRMDLSTGEVGVGSKDDDA